MGPARQPIGALTAAAGLGLLPFAALLCRERVVGPILQRRQQSGDLLQHVKDVAAAWHLGQSQLLTGPQARAEIGDGGPGGPTAVLQL